jgi:DNA primase
MPTYPSTVLDEIRTGTDLVELVGRFVNLKKAGANWKGLCPFHSEKTPSFMVNPAKGIFHCFGCGAGGDAFGFVMRQDKLTFPEAVRALARSAGVALPDDRGPAEASGREELLRVMDLAARFYVEGLWGRLGQRARTYLDSRGVDAEVARRFGLGYAAEGWDHLLDFMRAERVAVDVLATLGLVVPRANGDGHYDRFRGRLMFAIRDLQGRVVAFGGRAFGDEQPKYLNSPETPLYTKGNLLYAADLARDGIRERKRALLVEGYVDCLMAHQYGFTETVAALGTAFTPAQLGVLRRYAEEVVTFFDGDAAGQRAAERAAELLDAGEGGASWAVNRSGAFDGAGALRLKVALLPAGEDPDTFLRTRGAPAFAERIEASRSLLGYAVDRAIADPDGGTGPRARAGAFARVALMLAKVTDADEAAALSREAALKLGVDPAQLWIESQRLSTALRRPGPSPRPAPAAAPARAEERALVRLLLVRPDARASLLPLVDDAEIAGDTLRAIVAALRGRPDAAAESLLSDLDDAARNALAALLVDDDERGRVDLDAAIADYRRRLETQRKLRRIRALSRDIAAQYTGEALPHDAYRTLTDESRSVLDVVRGGPPAYHPGPEHPQGVQTHE